MDTAERKWRDVEYGYFTNSGLDGQPVGYHMDLIRHEKRHWWSARVGIYQFTLDPINPLQWHLGARPLVLLGLPAGTIMEPCREQGMESDWASIPSLVTWGWQSDRFLGAIFHDDHYEHGYAWIRQPEGIWYKRPMTRFESDKCLEFEIGSQDGDAVDRGAWFQAVHLFGGSTWAAHGR